MAGGNWGRVLISGLGQAIFEEIEKSYLNSLLSSITCTPLAYADLSLWSPIEAKWPLVDMMSDGAWSLRDRRR